jgi:hypothetical protein
MEYQRHVPEREQVSVLLATILLAYALTRVINAPDAILSFKLGSVPLSFSFNMNIAIALLAGGLAGTGMEWLLRGHPSIQPGETIEHWLLPTLMALVIGTALYSLPTGVSWWLGFALGGWLLLTIFRAEYTAVDPADRAYPFATASLTAISFALVLILAVVLRSTGQRLVVLSPALFITSGLASLRVLHLRLNERWEFGWAVGIAMVATQIGTALHYWPITPVQFGLAVLAPVYALTSLAVNLIKEIPVRRALIEPAFILSALWGLAFILSI